MEPLRLWMADDADLRPGGTVAVMPEPLRAAGLLLARGPDGGPDRPGSDELIRAERRGLVRRVRRGAYVGVDHWSDLDAASRHVLVVRATLTAQPEARVSHWSAAAVLGLPMVGRDDDRVHLTVGPAAGGRSRGSVRRHQATGLVDEHTVDGIRITSPARTLVDLARYAGLVPAVAAGDAALRSGLVTRADLEDELAACGPGRGVRTARRAVQLMDPRAESPGESLSRVRIVELGLPLPQLQHEVRDRRGFVARVDFWWQEQGLVGEFDGRTKYGIDGASGAAERLWQEKRREDRIRAAGHRVVRWTWDDAWRGEPLARLLREAGLR